MLFAAAGFSVCVIPRLLPFFLIALGVSLFVFEKEGNWRKSWRVGDLNAVHISVGLFLAYLVINTLWSPDKVDAALKAGSVAVMTAAAVATSAILSRRNSTALLSWCFILAYGCGVIVVLAIFLTSQSLRIAFHSWFPFLAGDIGKDLVKAGDTVVRVQDYRLNRNVANATLFLAPVIFLARNHGSKFRLIFAGCISALVIAVTFLSQSETAKLALLAAILVFAFTGLSCRIVRIMLAVARHGPASGNGLPSTTAGGLIRPLADGHPMLFTGAEKITRNPAGRHDL